MGKMIVTVFAALVLLVLVYFAFRGVASWRQGYSWNEMDWSQKGSTSIADFFAANDIGKREVQLNGLSCSEYYAPPQILPASGSTSD